MAPAQQKEAPSWTQCISDPSATLPASGKLLLFHTFVVRSPSSWLVEGVASAAELLLHPQKGQKVWVLQAGFSTAKNDFLNTTYT